MKSGSAKKTRLVVMMIGVAVVLLLSPACTTDYWPNITGLRAQADWTAPGASVRVTCTASDPGGAGLTYQWSASAGSITGTGATIEWTAPQDVGMYDITVTVTSAQGRQSSESVALVVSDGPPPVIHSLIPAARDHKYLKEISIGYRAARTYKYEIDCVASATSGEPVYEWSATGGEISGEGLAIIWTAPNRDGRFTVTVKVFDGAGNWVRKSIVFEVVDCEACVVW